MAPRGNLNSLGAFIFANSRSPSPYFLLERIHFEARFEEISEESISDSRLQIGYRFEKPLLAGIFS
jgi:hypothetical protein